MTPLDRYRAKRDPQRTPEPVPPDEPPAGARPNGSSFVIQEHHARSLHWDFRWAMFTTGPMVTVELAGSPTTTVLNAATIASVTASATSDGTSTRRIAVHFWPALEVISRTTSRTKKSNDGDPGFASTPRSAAFRLSASMFTRTSSRMPFRISLAVWADPVNRSEEHTSELQS